MLWLDAHNNAGRRAASCFRHLCYGLLWLIRSDPALLDARQKVGRRPAKSSATANGSRPNPFLVNRRVTCDDASYVPASGGAW